MQLIDLFVVLVAILLIAAVLMQNAKDDIRDAFSGEKSELFKNQKERGFELFMTRFTAGVAMAFLVLVIIASAITRF